MLNASLKRSKTSSIYSYCLVITVLLSTMHSCKKDGDIIGGQKNESSGIATRWADLTLSTLRYSYFNTPTYSSRSLGYLGVTMYESVVHSDTTRVSLSGQLNGLTNLPVPEAGAEYYWPLALNAGQQTLLRLLYPEDENLHPLEFNRIDSLYEVILAEKSKGIAQPTIERSVQFGKNIAAAVYQWSLNDGGHYGFKRNFDPTYIFPKGPSYWVPPIRGQTISNYPLHPRWGNNRTFILANNITVPAIISYSKDPASAYYRLYNDVYVKNKILTLPEKEIAAWWADDPTETFSPPGHSYNLATIAIKKANVNFIQAAEAYARTGMAVADAFINCWKAKVTYFNERPSTYVRANIDPAWISYWPEPPFPAFPSGHSLQIGACATVLTAVFGENFAFTDNSHEGTRRFSPELLFNSRSFSSFWAAAEECAYSRFLGGIHTQQDNQVGLDKGKIVGQNVNGLNWRK